METVIFFLFAALALGSALVVVAHRSPIYATLSLVLTLFSMAVLFVLLGAPFVGALQILVYAGAIVVLFLFVIMLLNVQKEEDAHVDRGVQLWIAVLGAVVFLGMFWLAFWRTGLRIGGPRRAAHRGSGVAQGARHRAVHRLPAAVRDRRPAAAGGGHRRHGRRPAPDSETVRPDDDYVIAERPEHRSRAPPGRPRS